MTTVGQEFLSTPDLSLPDVPNASQLHSRRWAGSGRSRSRGTAFNQGRLRVPRRVGGAQAIRVAYSTMWGYGREMNR